MKRILLSITFVFAIFFSVGYLYAPMPLTHGINHYSQENQLNEVDISDKWMTIMTIFSTLFAVFFVYSWFKIDWTVNKVEEAEKRILILEKEAKNDMEFANQLKYAIQYMLSRQYQKAIDALIVLRNEPFVLKNDCRLDSCSYFLAVCYFEQGLIYEEQSDIDSAQEYISKAQQFITEAIDDPSHPLVLEIRDKFDILLPSE
jgi:tetratricopeptide (TPR) repeat protein